MSLVFVGGGTVGDQDIDITPPAVPTNLAVTPSHQTASLTWTANTEGDFASYTVQQSTDDVGFSDIITGLVTNSFTATGLISNTTYFWRIAALDQDSNQSAFSSSVTGTTLLPAAPTGLVVDAITSSQAVLNWNDNSEPNFASYTVLQDAVVIATGVSASAYTATGLSQNTTYTWTVRAVDTDGNSGPVSPGSKDVETVMVFPGIATAIRRSAMVVTVSDAPDGTGAVGQFVAKFMVCPDKS